MTSKNVTSYAICAHLENKKNPSHPVLKPEHTSAKLTMTATILCVL